MSTKKKIIGSTSGEAPAEADLEKIKNRIVETIDLEIGKFRGGVDSLTGTYTRPDDIGGEYTRHD